MKLYHGCSETTARLVMEHGLLPRKFSKSKGNWKHTVNSNTNMVYLTAAYAPYFAVHATDIQKNERMAIVEVDVDLLDHNKMFPDEDFVEQQNHEATYSMGTQEYPSLEIQMGAINRRAGQRCP
jgi:hypothetical protein